MQTELNRRRWAVQLALTSGLALLVLAALLWGVLGVTLARADPGTLYVDGDGGSDDSDCSNPADPCATIGYALTRAGSGDEILVAAGTYTETLDIHGNPITLRGGYTASGAVWLRQGGETIVDADGADRPVCTIGPNNDVTVEGFTVQGANHVSDWGGGFSINGATVVISDTVIRDNSTNGWGAGGFVENSVGATNIQVSLIDSTVFGNNAPNGCAGLIAGAGDPFKVSIENTVFTGNTGLEVLSLDQTFQIAGGQVSSNTGQAIAIGGSGSGTISGTKVVSNTSGAIANSGALTVTNSIIENHTGADWTVWSDNHLVMDGCTIRDNGTWGIVHIRTGHTEIRNTMVVDNDNAAVNGDIIGIGGEPTTTPTVEMINLLVAGNRSARPTVNGSSPNGSIMLMNVTVTDNTSPQFPVLAGNGNWTVTNSVVWGNTTPGDMLGLGTFSVSYSNIEGGWTGTGNIEADPRFVDDASGDYHPGVGSPCIDQGTTVGAPTHDIEGTPRDAAPDMGAYEWTGFRVFLPLALTSFGP
jgi:hypothetical protein